LTQSPELSLDLVLPIYFSSTTLVSGFLAGLLYLLRFLSFPFFPSHGPQLTDAEMDYVVEDVMIGSSALVAASAEYRGTGGKDIR
jgi:hypothetical protein